MNQDVDLIQCVKCGKIREKFLLACPKCGGFESEKADPSKGRKLWYNVTLEYIRAGAEYYKKNLEDVQKQWFKEKIPNQQPWQYYAGIITANRLSLIWLRELLPIEAFNDPITCTNVRVYYLVSFMTETKQKLFCDFINNLFKDKNENNKHDIQGETGTSLSNTSP